MSHGGPVFAVVCYQNQILLGEAEARLPLSVWKSCAGLRPPLRLFVIYDGGGMGNLRAVCFDRMWPVTWARRR